MSQHRYHIHVCLVKNEQPDLENALQIALADSYFLTWDLSGTPPNFMDYTRKQIDHCDYVLFVLGDSYGNLSPSGVSFLHLSYVYATTKRKTLFALIKQAEAVAPQDNTRTRQRADFSSMVEKDQADYTTFYANNLTTAVKQCLFTLNQLIEAVPKSGWIKSAKLHLEQHDRLSNPNQTTLSAKRHQSETSHSNLKTTPLKTETVKQSVTSDPDPVSEGWLTNADIKQATPAAITTTKASTSLVSQSAKHSTDEKDALSLEDTVSVRYTAHAYKEGNLAELDLQQELMWLDIVVSLRKMKEPFSSDMMQRNLNHLLNGFALTTAREVQPHTHAVARTQINLADFDTIKKQLIVQHWLTQATPKGLQRDLWQLSNELR